MALQVYKPAPGASLIHGDAVEALRVFGADRFDSVVTDPPYELGFMGKAWDGTSIAFSVEFWRETLRVLKPGAHLLAFGGTRTYHRMTCAIEDAGFEVRDSLHWFYGTGFPKSLNLGRGQGTALKPGHEPIVLARKPPRGPIARNVADYGTGALNIDACRIATADADVMRVRHNNARSNSESKGADLAHDTRPSKAGRWPANVLLDEQTAAELDEQTAGLKSGGRLTGAEPGTRDGQVAFGKLGARPAWEPYGDAGGASRFFYIAKPSRKERDLGCDHLPAKSGGEATDREDGSAGTRNPRAGAGRNGGARNFHPTVKPVELMRYLVRLITPPAGTVLDPFTGSGTTGMAALLEQRAFVGIEREAEYLPIATARIATIIQIPEHYSWGER